MNATMSKWTAGIAAAASFFALVGGSTGTAAFAKARAATVTISETGSSLLYPLFNGEWVPAYTALHPNIQISSAATGSGAGISQAIAGTVQIGGSDAYMADAQMAANPSMVNIPLAISAQQVMYNVPGVNSRIHLKLTGHILAGIYEGKIKFWNDKQIVKLNKHVRLPHKQIIPVHRSDGSGDTFLFTQFLSKTDAGWAQSVNFSTSVSWPAVSDGIGAKGNSGVVQALSSNPYSISYVGVSWLDKATHEGIGYAALQNRAGAFVLPTTAGIQAAASIGARHIQKDERASLIDEAGKNSYPIVNFEYAIVNTKQQADIVRPLKQFLEWTIDSRWGGNKSTYLNPVHFLPLPKNVKPLSEAQISKIGK